MSKKVPVTNADREKSYFKYYAEDCALGDPEKYAKITPEPYDNKNALHIEDKNRLFEPGDLVDPIGWWQLEDGTAIIANRTFFPGVDGEIFDWWFAWHPIDRLRYAIWDNEDHYDVYVDDPAHTVDMSLNMKERHWDSVHNIWEDIGTGEVDLLRLSFKRPRDVGYDEPKVGTSACNSLVCANVIVVGTGDKPDVPVFMTHFLRPCEGGSELRSYFWFGWQIIDGKPVRSIPEDAKIPSKPLICLLNHNLKEYANLSRILPGLYAEEKDNWF